MLEVVCTVSDERGRVFELFADMSSIRSSISQFLDIDADDEDYGINHIRKGDPDSEERFTKEERSEDEDSFRKILNYEYYDWRELIEKIQKKKNGTFAKGRVLLVHRGITFAHYWEDSYGWNAPEIRIKNTGDLTATLLFDHIIEGY